MLKLTEEDQKIVLRSLDRDRDTLTRQIIRGTEVGFTENSEEIMQWVRERDQIELVLYKMGFQ